MLRVSAARGLTVHSLETAIAERTVALAHSSASSSSSSSLCCLSQAKLPPALAALVRPLSLADIGSSSEEESSSSDDEHDSDSAGREDANEVSEIDFFRARRCVCCSRSSVDRLVCRFVTDLRSAPTRERASCCGARLSSLTEVFL